MSESEKNTQDILGNLLEGKPKKDIKPQTETPREITKVQQKKEVPTVKPNIHHSSYVPQKSFTLIELTKEQLTKAANAKIKVIEGSRKWGPHVVLDSTTSIYGFGETVELAVEDCINNIVAWKGLCTK